MFERVCLILCVKAWFVCACVCCMCLCEIECFVLSVRLCVDV